MLASEALHHGYRPLLDERGQQLLDNLRISSNQMSLVLEGVLVLGRARRQKMVYDEFDISALASSVQNSLPGGRWSDRIDWQIEDGLKAWGDERLIRIVLQNLLGNALKYCGKEANACIWFGATEHRGEFCFYIADNGVGFIEEEAEALFQPFRRLHGEESPATGIGLSTVDRVIRRHGGWVAAQASPGDGATFFFTLPGQVSG